MAAAFEAHRLRTVVEDLLERIQNWFDMEYNLLGTRPKPIQRTPSLRGLQGAF